MKIKLIIIISIFLSVYSVAADNNNVIKYPIAITIITDEHSCWNCLNGINHLANTKLDYSYLQIQIILSTTDDGLEEKIKKQYKIKPRIIQDPENLYVQKYNFKLLPGIVIKDDVGNIITQEIWDESNKYIEIVKKLDKNNKEKSSQKIEGISQKKIFDIKISDSSTFKPSMYFDLNYDEYSNNFSLLSYEDTKSKIYIIDSNGFIKKTIYRPCNKLRDCFFVMGSTIFRDSLFVFTFSVYGEEDFERDFAMINLNDSSISKYKENIYPKTTADLSSINSGFKILPSGKLILKHYPYNNIYLDSSFKLLALTDTNFEISKYFGIADSICAVKKNSIIMKNTSITTDENSNIYFIQENSKNVHQYDSNGNFIKDIHLNFSDNYKTINKDFSDTLDKMEVIDYEHNYSLLQESALSMNKGIFTVAYCDFNIHNQFHYIIEKFDVNGKKLLSKPIILPWSKHRLFKLDSNRIMLYLTENNKVTICIYYFE